MVHDSVRYTKLDSDNREETHHEGNDEEDDDEEAEEVTVYLRQ